MSDIIPQSKIVEYSCLRAEVDYQERTLTLINKDTSESITIPALAFNELRAIMSDIGQQTLQPQKPGYHK